MNAENSFVIASRSRTSVRTSRTSSTASASLATKFTGGSDGLDPHIRQPLSAAATARKTALRIGIEPIIGLATRQRALHVPERSEAEELLPEADVARFRLHVTESSQREHLTQVLGGNSISGAEGV